MVTTISSHEFNQDFSAAKRAASEGPVVIMDRGKPGYVLMSYDEWIRVAGKMQTIGEWLAMPEAADIELELPDRGSITRAADLS